MRPALLETLLEGTAAQTGGRVTSTLVRSLADALQVDGAWVTEYLKGPRQLGHYASGCATITSPITSTTSGTRQCETAIEQKQLVRYPQNVIELFPRDARNTTGA